MILDLTETAFHNYFRSINGGRKVIKDKCEDPAETCKRIKGILKSLFDQVPDMDMSQLTIKSPLKNVWSSLNIIKRYNCPLLTVGGKGASKDLAEASGHGELMERLQMGYLFSQNPYRERLKPYYVKEVSDEMLDLNNQIAQKIRQNNFYFPEMRVKSKKYLEFFDITNKKTAFLQERFIGNANGSAAGNCYEEAFIQGICEQFERYAAINVVLNKIPCPTIPRRALHPRILELISEIETLGIKVIIKDFSLQKNLPVVGTIFIYEEFEEYELKVGSATSMYIAIERCLTEFCQVLGFSLLKTDADYKSVNNLIKKHLFRINSHFSIARSLYKTFPYIEEYLPYHTFISLRFPHHYFFPTKRLTFLQDNYGLLKIWDYSERACTREIPHLIELCKEHNWNIYIRDFGWLGFPTMKVFIPDLSFGHSELVHYTTQKIERFKVKLLTDLNSISKQDLDILSTPEFLVYACLNNLLVKFFKLNYRKSNFINVWNYFGLLANALGRNDIEKLYFKQAFAYSIDLKTLQTRKKDGRGIITSLREHLPHCLHSCEDCTFKNECRYFLLHEIEHNIAARYSDTFTIDPPI